METQNKLEELKGGTIQMNKKFGGLVVALGVASVVASGLVSYRAGVRNGSRITEQEFLQDARSATAYRFAGTDNNRVYDHIIIKGPKEKVWVQYDLHNTKEGLTEYKAKY